jgi:hypothetical protein
MTLASKLKDVKEYILGPTPLNDQELKIIVKRIFDKHSLYDDQKSDFNMTIRSIWLWLLDFDNTDEVKANTKILIKLLTDLYHGNIKVSRANVKRLKNLLDLYHNHPLKLNGPLPAYINSAISDDGINGDDLDKLADLFACNQYFPDVCDTPPCSKWLQAIERGRSINLESPHDPGEKIYKIVESYRYFDIMKASEIYAKVRALSPTVKAVCMYELCSQKFKVDQRVAALIKNDMATKLLLGKNVVGFYCCDEHAMEDRNIGRRELVSLCLSVSTAWSNKFLACVDMDGIKRWCIKWKGQNVRASSFVTTLTDHSSDPQISSLTPWWQERFSPFWTFPKLYLIAEDLQILVDELAKLFPKDNY